ncbi:MAG: hypothetical protein AAFQ17_04945, partial [Pseudomonadota bacterium]
MVDARGWSDERVKQHFSLIDWPLWPSIVYRREPELVSGFPELSTHTPPRTLFEIDPKSQELIVYFTGFRRDILSYATDHDTTMAFLGAPPNNADRICRPPITRSEGVTPDGRRPTKSENPYTLEIGSKRPAPGRRHAKRHSH